MGCHCFLMEKVKIKKDIPNYHLIIQDVLVYLGLNKDNLEADAVRRALGPLRRFRLQ